MSMRVTFVSYIASLILLGLGGCAATRRPEAADADIDDASVTTRIKSRYAENQIVDAARIHVETLNGSVTLSGFASSELEKSTAEIIAWNMQGVTAVRNEIAIRP